MSRILRAYERLDVGALIVGDSPTWRLDSMPYGGVKDSGEGREGMRAAIRGNDTVEVTCFSALRNISRKNCSQSQCCHIFKRHC